MGFFFSFYWEMTSLKVPPKTFTTNSLKPCDVFSKALVSLKLNANVSVANMLKDLKRKCAATIGSRTTDDA